MIPGLFAARASGAAQPGGSLVDRWGTSDLSVISPGRTDGEQISSVGNGRAGGPSATQATPANQPIYDKSSIPGLDVIQLSSASSLGIPLAGQFLAGVIQIDTSRLTDGDVIVARATDQSGTAKAAFELRIVLSEPPAPDHDYGSATSLNVDQDPKINPLVIDGNPQMPRSTVIG